MTRGPGSHSSRSLILWLRFYEGQPNGSLVGSAPRRAGWSFLLRECSMIGQNWRGNHAQQSNMEMLDCQSQIEFKSCSTLDHEHDRLSNMEMIVCRRLPGVVALGSRTASYVGPSKDLPECLNSSAYEVAFPPSGVVRLQFEGWCKIFRRHRRRCISLLGTDGSIQREKVS
jgi:hypothetical protein